MYINLWHGECDPEMYSLLSLTNTFSCEFMSH